MSLNNGQMLPGQVRKMRQMNELLDAEDGILDEFEKVLEEMYQRASFLHEELINEKWLEEKLHNITGGTADVKKKAGELFVEIAISKGNLSTVDADDVISFLNKWLPAHLAYSIVYEKMLSAINYHAVIWQEDEIITLRQVKV